MWSSKLALSGLLVLVFAVPAVGQRPIERGEWNNLHLEWSIGDRGTTVTLDYEIRGEDMGRSQLKANFRTNAGDVILEGRTLLDDDEAMQVLNALKAADVWQLPDRNELAANEVDSKGIEHIVICRSGLEMRVQDMEKRKWLVRDCPDLKNDAAVVALARAMIEVARKSFPYLAAGEAWREALRR